MKGYCNGHEIFISISKNICNISPKSTIFTIICLFINSIQYKGNDSTNTYIQHKTALAISFLVTHFYKGSNKFATDCVTVSTLSVPNSRWIKRSLLLRVNMKTRSETSIPMLKQLNRSFRKKLVCTKCDQ